MSVLPQPPKDHRQTDADHLRLLSIFHFVGAGLAFLGILFVFVHFAISQTMLNNPQLWQNQQQGYPPDEFFAAIKWLYLVCGAWFFASAVLNVISALLLYARKYRTFSLVVGGINCLHIPLGTVLGIITITVLIRDSVRELYER